MHASITYAFTYLTLLLILSSLAHQSPYQQLLKLLWIKCYDTGILVTWCACQTCESKSMLDKKCCILSKLRCTIHSKKLAGHRWWEVNQYACARIRFWLLNPWPSKPVQFVARMYYVFGWNPFSGSGAIEFSRFPWTLLGDLDLWPTVT